jgi:hypothetical protein
MKNSLGFQMASNRYLLQIKKIKRWLFLLLAMEAIEEEIDHKTTLAKTSETLQLKVKDYSAALNES